MMIDHVEVERPEGSFYNLVICGEGFGDRLGQVNVWNAGGMSVPHVDIKSWDDAKIVVEVTDAAMNTGSGLMPGPATVEVVPVPGMMMGFDVPDPSVGVEETGPMPDGDPAHTADYDGLRAHAEALGVKVDRRWGEDRLRQEIQSAETPADE
jgi:hypothetical protein